MDKYIVENKFMSLKKRNDGTFIVSLYDKNGHYIDQMYVDGLDVKDLYDALDKSKEDFM